MFRTPTVDSLATTWDTPDMVHMGHMVVSQDTELNSNTVKADTKADTKACTKANTKAVIQFKEDTQ